VDLIDELYFFINDAVSDVDGKILVPISGGLDSRVLAGILSKRRQIDLSYVYITEKYYRHSDYARRIQEILNVGRFVEIFVSEKDINEERYIYHDYGLPVTPMLSALRHLDSHYNLKDYTLYIPHGLEFLTGIEINPISLLTGKCHGKKIKDYEGWFVKDFHPNMEDKWIQTIGCHFTKHAISATWSSSLVEFCLDLPLQYRFHQYLYRKMIRKYFPKLAAIERDGMDIRMDCGEVKYFMARIKYFIKKKVVNAKYT